VKTEKHKVSGWFGTKSIHEPMAYEVEEEGQGQEEQGDESEQGSAPIDLEVDEESVSSQRHTGTKGAPYEIVLWYEAWVSWRFCIAEDARGHVPKPKHSRPRWGMRR
jgi:hypothetical protein